MAESGSPREGENELTMFDVLEEQQELEDDAKAVLGDSDDTNCTYYEGYVPRQALYACATCKSAEEPGGICLACSYACHEGHELIELYTKRDFRCDCGNKKFPNSSCCLCPQKDEVNPKNKYNQNFKGVYCNCSRPYPDLVDDVPDEMIQCVICEDWYHGRHLGGKVPDNEDYGEMICTKCMESLTFLKSYLSHFKSGCQESADVNVETESGDEGAETKNIVNSALAGRIKTETININNPCAPKVEIKQETPTNVDQKNNHVETSTNKEIKQELSTDNDGTNSHSIKNEVNAIKQELVDSKSENFEIKSEKKHACALKNLRNDAVMIPNGPAFWPENWRKELCRCADCMIMYEKESCTFLLDDSDTIKAYEERGKCRSGEESQYDRGLSALSRLDRVKQIEAIQEYNNMKGELKEYLKQFADAKRTVSERDIKDFFEGMQRRKRQRVESIPYFCR